MDKSRLYSIYSVSNTKQPVLFFDENLVLWTCLDGINTRRAADQLSWPPGFNISLASVDGVRKMVKERDDFIRYQKRMEVLKMKKLDSWAGKYFILAKDRNGEFMVAKEMFDTPESAQEYLAHTDDGNYAFEYVGIMECKMMATFQNIRKICWD